MAAHSNYSKKATGIAILYTVAWKPEKLTITYKLAESFKLVSGLDSQLFMEKLCHLLVTNFTRKNSGETENYVLHYSADVMPQLKSCKQKVHRNKRMVSLECSKFPLFCFPQDRVQFMIFRH
ncbi:Hypothetical predicted protein [Podarcis lilfordi]|uniref:Uncharacterized protein n=1 Tax=Podarcis lilfordi TaxID=74358 RepID=A0AA35LAY2_9SAUR|nr:Hypothetical predicted protein [Podarcis lilfordi]